MEANQGISSFVHFVRGQASGMDKTFSDPSLLGSMVGSSLQVDGTSELIPTGDYSIIRGTSVSSGDRVLCIPAGGVYVIVGVVD